MKRAALASVNRRWIVPYCPSVLCPVDFSNPSRAALCYAAAIADHFAARLTIITVDDPLLAAVAASTAGADATCDRTEQELRRFSEATLARMGRGTRTLDFRVAVGKPATEILHVAREVRAELIVMSSHGRSGFRKMFFGSTTESVLRETTVPVLVTPDDRERVVSVSEMSGVIKRVLAPVDLTAASSHQVTIAAGLAAAFAVPLIVAHVVQPVFIPPSLRLAMRGIDAERRSQAEDRLVELAASAARDVAAETMVVAGEPSEEIVKLARTRDAHLIVMGLHSSGMLGPRMGSVTYRVLCLAHTLVLALPPTPRSSRPHADTVDGVATASA